MQCVCTLQNDVTFPGSNPLRCNRSGLNVSNGESWNPKLTLKVNGLWIEIRHRNFSSQVLSRHTFKISRKKRMWFFGSQGHLKTVNKFIKSHLHIYRGLANVAVNARTVSFCKLHVICACCVPKVDNAIDFNCAWNSWNCLGLINFSSLLQWGS